MSPTGLRPGIDVRIRARSAVIRRVAGLVKPLPSRGRILLCRSTARGDSLNGRSAHGMMSDLAGSPWQATGVNDTPALMVVFNTLRLSGCREQKTG